MCLQETDSKLYNHLIKHNLTGILLSNIFSSSLRVSLYVSIFIPGVMTFSVCMPPLEEVLILWDFLFAYGFHLNILCIVAHLQIMRNELLESSTPMKLLRNIPELNAKKLILMTIDIVNQLDEDLYDMLVRHPFDPTIYEAIIPNP